jgi:hypothetical protein
LVKDHPAHVPEEHVGSEVVVAPPLNLSLVYAPSGGSAAIRVTDGFTAILWGLPSQGTDEGEGKPTDKSTVASGAELSIVHVIGIVTVTTVRLNVS